MNLFILVSSKPKLANLPPVLELAQPGDQVLWLESDPARQRNWTAGPRLLLEQAGLGTLDVLTVQHLNDPTELSVRLQPIVASLAGRFSSVYLVTNGGTKHTPIGLCQAFHPLSAQPLYGEDCPVGYRVYRPDFQGSSPLMPYTRLQLDLPDLLRLNDYTFAKGSEHQRIWPDPLPETISNERYGIDEPYTYQLHAQHFSWSTVQSAQQRVLYDRLFSLIPDGFRRWMRTVQLVRDAMNPQNLCNLYNGTLNLAEAARIAAARRDQGIDLPVARLGQSLERALARRVRDWQAQQQHPAIRSIWAGVKIARLATPHLVEAEFDTLIVLKNGILVHLESKSASVDTRALDVNLHRLRQASSPAARSVVALPVFTRCSQDAWFAPIHQVRLQLEEFWGRANLLAFTWPGQPETYCMPGNAFAEPIRVAAFEEDLTRLLHPYHGNEREPG